MTAKRKITLIAGAALLIALMAVLAVFSVWAASSRTLKSTVTVTYESKEVVGSATASYYVGADYTATAFENGGTSGKVDFGAGEQDGEGQTVSPNAITLDETNQYVVFEYKFENSSDHLWYANLATTGTAENVTVYFGSKATTAIDNATIKDWSELTGEGKALTQTTETATGITMQDVEVAANNGVTYAYVAVKIKDLGNKITFENINFTWTLKTARTGAGA